MGMALSYLIATTVLALVVSAKVGRLPLTSLVSQKPREACVSIIILFELPGDSSPSLSN